MTLDKRSFHPMRFMERPHARPMLQYYAQHVGTRLMTMDALQGLMMRLYPLYNEALSKLPVADRPGNMDVATKELSMIGHVGAFTAHGRNIVYVPPALGSLLMRTSLESVRFSDLKLPFPSFYIALQDVIDASLPGAPNAVDGVYVSSFGEIFQLMITSRRLEVDGARQQRWITHPEPYYYISLRAAPERTLQEALDEAVQTGELPLEPDSDALDAMDRAIEALREDAATEHGIDLRVPAERAAVRSARFNLAGFAVAKTVATLAINVVCYMTAEPEDLEGPTSVDDAPAGLVAQLQSTMKGRRIDARQRLLNDGYFEVRWVGRRVSRPSAPGAHGAGGARAFHWRRGHYRRRHHGPGGQSVKLIWIAPTTVGVADSSEMPPGRIHRLD